MDKMEIISVERDQNMNEWIWGRRAPQKFVEWTPAAVHGFGQRWNIHYSAKGNWRALAIGGGSKSFERALPMPTWWFVGNKANEAAPPNLHFVPSQMKLVINSKHSRKVNQHHADDDALLLFAICPNCCAFARKFLMICWSRKCQTWWMHFVFLMARKVWNFL